MQLKRKILFLPRWYPVGDDLQNGVFIQKHARAAALHNEVIVLYAAPSSGKSRISKTSDGNLTEIFIFYKKKSFAPFNFLLYVKALMSGWKMISSTGFRPDIAHVNMLSRPAILAIWLKWKFRIPFIITEHWSGYITGEFAKQNILKKWFVSYLFKNAALATAVSAVLKEAIQRCGLKNDVRLLPNVVETMPDAWKQKPVSSVFRYLIVADLKDEIKNISGAIRAFANVYRNEIKIELVIAGDGKDRKKLEESAKALFKDSPSHPIIFLGEKSNEEILKLIPTAHAVIVNSRIETFSVVTLEAIFSGRPVIAARCGGPEQFINKQNGILIDIENDKQLEEAMLLIKKNHDQYPPEKVKDSMPNNYTLESVAALLDEYYKYSFLNIYALFR